MTNKNKKIILKEIKRIKTKNVFESQAFVSLPTPSDPYKLEIHLMPKFGYFSGSCVKFSMGIPTTYPGTKPSVKCLNKIFHPNISFSGGICFSMFSGDWSKNYTIEHYINGLLFFLNNPNPSSALNSKCVRKNTTKYQECVSRAICGEKIDGVKYDYCFAQEIKELNRSNIFHFYSFLDSLSEDCVEKVKARFKLAGKDLEFFDEIAKTEMEREMKIVPLKKAAVRMKEKLNYISEEDVEDTNIVKEIFCDLDGVPTIVLTNGYEKIDFEELKEVLKLKETPRILAKKKVEENLKRFSINSLPFFIYRDKFKYYVNERIFDEEEIYLSSGSDKFLLNILAKDFKKFIDEKNVVKIKTLPTSNFDNHRGIKNFKFYFNENSFKT